MPPDKAGQAPGDRRLQARRPHWPHVTTSYTSTGAAKPLTGTGPSGLTCDKPFGQGQGGRGDRMCPAWPSAPCARRDGWSAPRPCSPCAGHCQWLAPPLPRRSAQRGCGSAGPACAGPQRRSACIVSCMRQRRIAGAHGMIFVGHGCPEQRHNAVAHDLVHGAFIAVHGRHHALQHRIEELPGRPRGRGQRGVPWSP